MNLQVTVDTEQTVVKVTDAHPLEYSDMVQLVGDLIARLYRELHPAATD